MRQVTKTLNVYTYSELSPESKQRALDTYQDRWLDDWWYVPVIEEFVDECRNYGLDVSYKDVSFSGFWSQGDGACFVTDSIDLTALIDAVGFTFKHKALQNISLAYFDTYRIEKAATSWAYRYSHKNTVEVYYSDEFAGTQEADKHPRIAEYLAQKGEELAKKLEALKDTLCTDLYAALEKEYDYLTSDEVLIDMIGDRGFLQDGTLYDE